MSESPVRVEVVLVPLTVPAPLTGPAFALLDEHERGAAGARVGEVRRRYVVAHAAVRILLAQRLGLEPAALGIARESTGRPTVEGVSFNLSHSGDLGAIAMAPGGTRVGVDIERVRPRPHLDRLARRLFAPAEYDAWAALTPDERPRAFASRWTGVEAVLKARGSGIAGGLASARDPGAGWSCAPFDAGADHVGAAAVDAAAIDVGARSWRVDGELTRRGGTAR